MTIWFSNSSPKIPKSVISCPKFKRFLFCTKLCNKANWKISNMTIVFSNYSSRICKLDIFVPKFKNLYFAPNFTIKQIQGC